jgi:Ca2+-binding RTX toxin-like protein
MAYNVGTALAAEISQEYASIAVDYYPNGNPTDSPYLIVPAASATGAVVGALGFSAVTIQNNFGPTTVYGGDSAAQTVLASDGGLTFSASSGNTTVVAGGGNNRISFGGGTNEAITSIGNDTIISGSGLDTIDAGLGDNLIYTGSGQAAISVQGQDTIHAGSGLTSIHVYGTGSADVVGSAATGQITFIGGQDASTVSGGGGSITVFGGGGGGMFVGGSAGYNSIHGGAGATTIVGGGGGDTLAAGSGSSLLIAGTGNETLVGGASADTFAFKTGTDGGNGTVDMIRNFSVSADDKLWVGPPNDLSDRNYAIDHQNVTNGNDMITLQDGTKIVLLGVNAELGSSSII